MAKRGIPQLPQTPIHYRLALLGLAVLFALQAVKLLWGQPMADVTAHPTQPQRWSAIISQHLGTGRDIPRGTLIMWDARRRELAGRQLYEITELLVNDPAMQGQRDAACAALAECWPDLFQACPWCQQ